MTISRFPFLAQQLFNRPLALRLEKAEILMAALADHFGIAQLRMPNGRIRAFDDDGMIVLDADGPAAEPHGYDVIDGVAIIEVHGTLVQRQMGLRPFSGMTGYNAIRANLFTALEASEVRAIALDIDSPGGDSAGLFDLTDAIFAARGKKPIWAILDEDACSAGYAIAAAAERVTVPRTGIAGSIGVICMRVDISKMLEKGGVTVTIIQYGARKADGHPEIPLSPAERDVLQEHIDYCGDMFVNAVARYRGMSAESIRATEAAMFMGPKALAAGLADAVLSPADAFAELVKTIS